MIPIKLVLLVLILAACGSSPGNKGTNNVNPALSETHEQTDGNARNIAGEIHSLIEEGTPSSIRESLELINSRRLGNSEFGRMMSAIAVRLLGTVYPSVLINPPPHDPPQAHIYSRIMRDAERGVYTPAPAASEDFFELILPFLALYNSTEGERFRQAIPALLKAEQINPESVLPPLFLGLSYERVGLLDEAENSYLKAWHLSAGNSNDSLNETYPAAQGIARIMESRGQGREAANFLSELALEFPDNFEIKRQLAFVYFRNQDWLRAETVMAEIIHHNNSEGEFILMRAYVMAELKQWQQVQTALDMYARINPNNRQYLFLRARLEAEGFRNRNTAITYLRSLIRTTEGAFVDDEASVYAIGMLMESPRIEDQIESKELLQSLLLAPNPSHAVLGLALQDCINRQAWQEARTYMNRLLIERRSSEDLMNAYIVEHNLRNNAGALVYARELYERDRNNDNANFFYITALIDTGRILEAESIIENRLRIVSGGHLKSVYFFLQSRTQINEEQRLNYLRSSLFEDPRNLDALIAMFEIYHRRRDERRAVYYLRQALTIAPDNPLLRRYEIEYENALR